MRKQNSRTALRLPSQQRTQLEELIKKGKCENISQAIRAALAEYLKNA